MKPARKSLYVLPNAFTVGSIFCAFLAVIFALKGQDVDHLYRACLLVGLSALLDTMDGRVARLTNTQSDFGVQLDSLADLVAFGVAPGAILYQWASSGQGFFGVFVAFMFIACAAMRLARFNVQAAEDGGSSRFFLGLPTPAAAATLCSFIMLHVSMGRAQAVGATMWGTIVMAILLAVLMVSNVRYFTFKKMPFNNLTKTLLVGTLGVFTLLTALGGVWLAVHLWFMVYILVGIMMAMVSVGGRLRRTTLDE